MIKFISFSHTSNQKEKKNTQNHVQAQGFRLRPEAHRAILYLCIQITFFLGKGTGKRIKTVSDLVEAEKKASNRTPKAKYISSFLLKQ